MKEDTVIIAVPASSLSEATQARIAELTRERDEARADLIVARGLDQTVRDILKIRDGVSLIETVKRLVEERADDRSEYADLRLELFANREESAIDAARRMAAENNSLTERLRVAVKEREDMRQQRDDARRDASTALGAIVAIGEGIRSEPGEDILDAARRVVREREDMRQQRDAARIDADQYRNWLDAARERVADLESAIRTLGSVLP